MSARRSGSPRRGRPAPPAPHAARPGALDAPRARGYVLVTILVIGSIGIMAVMAIIAFALFVLEQSQERYSRAVGVYLAEAGVQYYRWHLTHDPEDFWDGTCLAKDASCVSQPYVHEVRAVTGERIGTYTLNITPAVLGTSVVTVASTGTPFGSARGARTVNAKLGIPSITRYATVSETPARFGEGTQIFGLVHSNSGIRVDGVAHNLVTSACTSYDDPDHGGPEEECVHTHQANLEDVFLAGRSFPVPRVDFDGFSADLAKLRGDAQSADGLYIEPSGTFGYRLIFQTNDTVEIRRVTALEPPPAECTNDLDQDGWGAWDIRSDELVQTSGFPKNGMIFVEDNVWVEGKVNTARLTIGVGTFPDVPSTNRSIIVNNDLLYTNTDGTDALGLFAQKHLTVGLRSKDSLRIDAALIAQKGRVGRFYYSPTNCGSTVNRDTLTLYGMIATNGRYGFAYTNGTGYQKRNIQYDNNLTLGPPPAVPLIGSEYAVLSWEEEP